MIDSDFRFQQETGTTNDNIIWFWNNEVSRSFLHIDEYLFSKTLYILKNMDKYFQNNQWKISSYKISTCIN